jgi:hypothetical protein
VRRDFHYADSLLLLAGGLLSTVTFVAVYGRLRATDEGFALLGLLVADPAWYVWLGSVLWRRPEPSERTPRAGKRATVEKNVPRYQPLLLTRALTAARHR